MRYGFIIHGSIARVETSEHWRQWAEWDTSETDQARELRGLPALRFEDAVTFGVIPPADIRAGSVLTAEDEPPGISREFKELVEQLRQANGRGIPTQPSDMQARRKNET